MASRDNDRTPFMFCIAEMAKRHYDVDVEFLQITEAYAYEAALFDDTGDVIVERLEYLYREASMGRRVTMFCAPATGTRMDFVVPLEIKRYLRSGRTQRAIRALGRPHAVTIRLRKMGLEGRVGSTMVSDAEVGRWDSGRRSSVATASAHS